MNFNLFGWAVLVERVTRKVGTILTPQSREELHQLGRVIAVGDGRQKEETKASLVKVGDLVYFQTNLVLASACSYEHGKEAYIRLHQGDLIARLSSNDVQYENFEMLGNWILLEPFRRSRATRIVLPETIKGLEFIFWRILKKGGLVKLPVEVGMEVIINTGRLNGCMMQALDITTAERKYKEFGYIDAEHVLGTVEGADGDTSQTE